MVERARNLRSKGNLNKYFCNFLIQCNRKSMIGLNELKNFSLIAALCLEMQNALIISGIPNGT